MPPAGGSVAATIDSLCTSRLTHRRTSAGDNEVTSGTAGPRQVVCGSGLAALNTAIVQPAKDATHEDQPPHASILTSANAIVGRANTVLPSTVPKHCMHTPKERPIVATRSYDGPVDASSRTARAALAAATEAPETSSSAPEPWDGVG